MVILLLTIQYSTKPAGKNNMKTVNMIGMIASNVLDGTLKLWYAQQWAGGEAAGGTVDIVDPKRVLVLDDGSAEPTTNFMQAALPALV